jgi:hypothetical protein
MTGVGEPVPGVLVWREAGGDGVPLDSLAAEGPFLLLFYLYDWSST